MANELRDHVWVITESATVEAGELRIRSIRYKPDDSNSAVSLERIKTDGSTEELWADDGESDQKWRESRLELRLTRGFKVTLADGDVLMLYLALDGVAR